MTFSVWAPTPVEEHAVSIKSLGGYRELGQRGRCNRSIPTFRPSNLTRSAVVLVGLLALVLGCSSAAPPDVSRNRSRITARIGISGFPLGVATGEGSVWVLSRTTATGCSRRRPCIVTRVDPRTNRIVGQPTRLPVEPWSLAVGAGSVWVTPNGADGRLVRIDARTGRITARISAHPVYFGSVVVVGGGFVWTANDDERYRLGSTVSKIDPAANRVVGRPLEVGSPQSLAFGHGALWDADHSGWLVKIDPATFKVVARRRLDFGPHGVVITRDAVVVADAHGSRLVEADPVTAKIQRVAKLSVAPIYPAVGAGSIWSASAESWSGSAVDDRVVRIRPSTLTISETLHLGASVDGVAFGFGSLWAAVTTGQLVRITPT
jgi:hypothetical protein